MLRALAVAIIGLAVSVPAAGANGLTPLAPPLQATTPLSGDARAERPAVEYSPRRNVFVLARQVRRGQDQVVLTTALDRSGRALRPGENVQGTNLGDLSDWASEPRLAYIFAVPLDATGNPIGARIQVSESPDPWPDNPLRSQVLPTGPAIAPVPPDGEHLVVWSGADPEPPIAPMWEIGSRRLGDPSAGAPPPQGRSESLPDRARRQAGGAIRRSRLSPGNGLVVYERVARRRVLRPLRRRELIGVMACRRARQCRLRVVTAIRGRRASRRITVAPGATERLYLRLTPLQRSALRRAGRARVTITLRFGKRKRTATLRVRT